MSDITDFCNDIYPKVTQALSPTHRVGLKNQIIIHPSWYV